ncbi:HD domain-containing protein [Candidatus Wolfebacteria bacterium]|nr:HD domain-containing protein [Candidatus Wolfebacteria bacterium]
MKYTKRLENAIRIASQYHNGQFRAEHDDLPYVSHPFSVAVLVSNYTDDEDVVIAALLHDTIEDTEMTHEKLTELFGEKITTLVENISEPKGDVPWKERKDIYLEKLNTGSLDALLIAAADKIHNMQSKQNIFNEQGRDFIKSLGLLEEKYIWYHGMVGEIVEARLAGNPIVKLYKETFKKEKEILV